MMNSAPVWVKPSNGGEKYLFNLLAYHLNLIFFKLLITKNKIVLVRFF